MNKQMKKAMKKLPLWASILLVILYLAAQWVLNQLSAPPHAVSVADVPAYSGSPYAVVNNNIPLFEESDLTQTALEY